MVVLTVGVRWAVCITALARASANSALPLDAPARSPRLPFPPADAQTIPLPASRSLPLQSFAHWELSPLRGTSAKIAPRPPRSASESVRRISPRTLPAFPALPRSPASPAHFRRQLNSPSSPAQASSLPPTLAPRPFPEATIACNVAAGRASAKNLPALAPGPRNISPATLPHRNPAHSPPKSIAAGAHHHPTSNFRECDPPRNSAVRAILPQSAQYPWPLNPRRLPPNSSGPAAAPLVALALTAN